jgi:hypothetical protein
MPYLNLMKGLVIKNRTEVSVRIFNEQSFICLTLQQHNYRTDQG